MNDLFPFDDSFNPEQPVLPNDQELSSYLFSDIDLGILPLDNSLNNFTLQQNNSDNHIISPQSGSINLIKKRTNPEYDESKKITQKRKRKEKDEKTILKMKLARAEKNRMSAKKSREKKRDYIQMLENEIIMLRRQLAATQQYVYKFQLIERFKNKSGCEVFNTLKIIEDSARNYNKAINDPSLITHIITMNHNEKFEIKIKLIENLAKEMVEIMIPLSVRLISWVIENDVNGYDPNEIVKHMKIPIEKANIMSEYIKCVFPDHKNFDNIKKNVIAKTKEIKDTVKMFVQSQRKVQCELKKLDKCIVKDIIPCVNPRVLDFFSKISPELASRPEFSNFATFELSDNDFTIDNLE